VLDRLTSDARASTLSSSSAARLRDQLFSVRKAVERQQMVAPKERTST
jgi:hypothetical protein